MEQIQTSKKNDYWLAIIVLLIIPISGVSIDINVPSLPALVRYFGTEKSLAQLTVTTYMMGFGLGQLFSGAVSDCCGRKMPFIFSMLVYIVAVLLSPWSQDIYQLLILRLIQGVAIAFLVVPIRAVLSDLFAGKEFVKIASYMTVAWAIGPIIAPAIGGYLQFYFSWKAPFYFLAGYAILMLIMVLIWLPETLVSKQPLHLLNILDNYKKMLFHRKYLIGLILLGLLFSTEILFGVVVPFLTENVLHYSAVEFGHMALLMGLAWFLGNMTNRLLIEIEPTKKVQFCFWMIFIDTGIMLIISLFQPINIYNIIIPIFVLLYFAGTAFPNFFVGCIALFPKMSGSANALMGAFMVLVASVSSACGALLKSSTQLPLTLCYFILTVACLFFFYMDKLTDRN